ITAFIMDTAKNNDTMVDAIESKCFAQGISFSTKHAPLCCMPHTAHLAVIKLLESIGAVEKSPKRKGTYQDIVMAPENDDNAVLQDDKVANNNNTPESDQNVPLKLHHIVHSVRSSPQRRRAWRREVLFSLDKPDPNMPEKVLLLILNTLVFHTSNAPYIKFEFFLSLCYIPS
ncbi:hypothetical protein B0H10DRAFT_1773516, partial [Mycena sp. CBHHK59/15]